MPVPRTRRRPVVLLVVLAVALAGASVRRVSSMQEVSQTFRVATYNIHKGANRRGVYDLNRTIEAIQGFDADLVAVQEAMRYHAQFNCDDQPALIAEGLRRRTGRPWRHAYVKAWITSNRQCQDRGQGDDTESEGLAFFSPVPIVAQDWVRLSEGRIGLAVRIESMPRTPVIVTHLEAVRLNQAGRAREIGVLLPWAVKQGAGLLIGDFNAEPDAGELGPVKARYRDAWVDAQAQGRTGGVASGSTRPNRESRIDYVFYAPDIDLTLDSVAVVDTTTTPDVGAVSDHHPVVATFRRNAPRGLSPTGETR